MRNYEIVDRFGLNCAHRNGNLTHIGHIMATSQGGKQDQVVNDCERETNHKCIRVNR